MAVRTNPRQTSADLQRWQEAHGKAMEALKRCPFGRVFLVAAEQPGTDDTFDVIVGVANNELRPHELDRLKAAVAHLSILFAQPPEHADAYEEPAEEPAPAAKAPKEETQAAKAEANG